jgi:hypothetical protein
VFLNGAAQIEETAMQFPKLALLHSLTCVQLRLITILGNCGCQLPSCALALELFYFSYVVASVYFSLCGLNNCFHFGLQLQVFALFVVCDVLS